jgi:hypothetical protein
VREFDALEWVRIKGAGDLAIVVADDDLLDLVNAPVRVDGRTYRIVGVERPIRKGIWGLLLRPL